MTVVSFPGKPAETAAPHIAGNFQCGACSHEWAGVIPVGSTHADCPKCGRHWGAPKNVVVPDEFWRCHCGETLFFLTPNGSMCRRCGIYSNDWAK